MPANLPMPGLFRPAVGAWAAAPQPALWAPLWNAALVDPLGHVHARTWAPWHAGTRRLLLRERERGAAAAPALWRAAAGNGSAAIVPLAYGLQQSALWQLVMGTTRRELFALALWCGASLVRQQLASSVDRETARRWRTRLGERLYRDVLSVPSDIGRCRPAPPPRDLLGGRLVVDIGLSALAAWATDAQGWAVRRIALTAGARRLSAQQLLGPGVLQPGPAAAVEASLLAFVQRHADGH